MIALSSQSVFFVYLIIPNVTQILSIRFLRILLVVQFLNNKKLVLKMQDPSILSLVGYW